MEHVRLKRNTVEEADDAAAATLFTVVAASRDNTYAHGRREANQEALKLVHGKMVFFLLGSLTCQPQCLMLPQSGTHT